MRIFLTGGFGYLGGRIAEHLYGQGHQLRIPTRRAAKDYPDWAQEVETVQANLGKEADLAQLCQGMDQVVHLASMNEVVAGTDPLGAVILNSVNSLKLLLAAQKAGVRRFIYFSTAHVYKSPLVGRLTEDLPCRPTHPYAYSHRAVEDYVFSFHDKKQIEGIVIRLSNGYGAPRDAKIDRWTLVANDLCRQAVTQKKLVLKGSGLEERNFITLTDVAHGVAHFVGLDPGSLGNGLFNLGGEDSSTVYDLALAIQRRAHTVLGYLPPIERPQPKPGESTGSLDFCVDKLKATGFVFSGSQEAELDRSLLLCQDAFGG